MEDGLPSLPRVTPLILIKEDLLDILACTEGLDLWLLRTLACSEIGCGLGEDKTDGQVGMPG
jgi:hypothetical protein